MNIEDKRVNVNMVLFKDMAAGGCFEYKSKFYIKESCLFDVQGKPKNATCLSDGTPEYFYDNDKCILVAATIEITK